MNGRIQHPGGPFLAAGDVLYSPDDTESGLRHGVMLHCSVEEQASGDRQPGRLIRCRGYSVDPMEARDGNEHERVRFRGEVGADTQERKGYSYGATAVQPVAVDRQRVVRR